MTQPPMAIDEVVPSAPPITRRGRLRTLTTEGCTLERSRAVLTVTSGTEVGRVISVTGESTLGRDDDCDVSFPDPSLSRRHARVSHVVTEYLLTDLGSTNGSFVNDQPVHTPTVLYDGDHVRLGAATTLRFSMVDPAEEEALRRVYESAARDALTGLSNRRVFEERFAAELAFAARHDVPLCVLMIDIDFFKRVNDTWGHPAGDAVLRAVGQLLGASVRTEDMVARYGGEEFAVLARGSGLDGGLKLAERLRGAVAALPVQHQGNPMRVTLSIGIASLGCAGDDATCASLLSLADSRLYRAKQQGRNRVVGV